MVITDDTKPGVGRRRVAVLAFVTAGVGAAVQLVEGPAGSGYGWGAAVISAVIVATPLVLLGLAVRSGEPRWAWVALALTVLLLGFVLLALVGNWQGQTTTERVLDSAVATLVALTAVGTWRTQVPLLRQHGR